MRAIIVKYDGECRKCGATLPVGVDAIYERHIGVFCPGCAPTDPEEIRAYRQEAGTSGTFTTNVDLAFLRPI